MPTGSHRAGLVLVCPRNRRASASEALGPGMVEPPRLPYWLAGKEGGRCPMALRASQQASSHQGQSRSLWREDRPSGGRAAPHSSLHGVSAPGAGSLRGQRASWGQGVVCLDSQPGPGAASPPSEVPGGTSMPMWVHARGAHVVSRLKAIQPPAALQPGAPPEGPRRPGPCTPRPPASQRRMP